MRQNYILLFTLFGSTEGNGSNMYNKQTRSGGGDANTPEEAHA